MGKSSHGSCRISSCGQKKKQRKEIAKKRVLARRSALRKQASENLQSARLDRKFREKISPFIKDEETTVVDVAALSTESVPINLTMAPDTKYEPFTCIDIPEVAAVVGEIDVIIGGGLNPQKSPVALIADKPFHFTPIVPLLSLLP